MAKSPVFAEAPALRKASGGGASRRQAKLQINFNYQICKYLSVIEIGCLFDYWHLGFVYFSIAPFLNAL